MLRRGQKATTEITQVKSKTNKQLSEEGGPLVHAKLLTAHLRNGLGVIVDRIREFAVVVEDEPSMTHIFIKTAML